MAACGLGLALLGGCASAVGIGIPTGEPIAASRQASQAPEASQAPVDLAARQQELEDQRKVEELARPQAQAYAAPAAPRGQRQAEGDADPEAQSSQAVIGDGVLPWPSINRWPGDGGENKLLSAEEAAATRQSLQERAAAQIRQAFEVMSLKRQREAAQQAMSNAVQRTKDVLTGIASRCRTGQSDEACKDEQLAGETPAAN